MTGAIAVAKERGVRVASVWRRVGVSVASRRRRVVVKDRHDVKCRILTRG